MKEIDIVWFEGSLLNDLRPYLALAQRDDVYRLRLTIDGGGLKIKANEGLWSPPIGRIYGV